MKYEITNKKSDVEVIEVKERKYVAFVQSTDDLTGKTYIQYAGSDYIVITEEDFDRAVSVAKDTYDYSRLGFAGKIKEELFKDVK